MTPTRPPGSRCVIASVTKKVCGPKTSFLMRSRSSLATAAASGCSSCSRSSKSPLSCTLPAQQRATPPCEPCAQTGRPPLGCEEQLVIESLPLRTVFGLGALR